MIPFSPLDTIATLRPIPRERLTLLEPDYESIQELPIGQVGTILEIYTEEAPRYLVEFADQQGCEYALAILHPDEILTLNYELHLAGTAK
jgi:hypothetical protein